MTLYFKACSRELFHQASDIVKRTKASLGELGGICMEADALLEFIKVFLLVQRATIGVNHHTGERVGTLVLVVGHAILVKVRDTTVAVHLGSSLGIGALVLVVGHTILIMIRRAAVFADFNARFGIGALVHVIRHTIVIEITHLGFFLLRGILHDNDNRIALRFMLDDDCITERTFRSLLFRATEANGQQSSTGPKRRRSIAVRAFVAAFTREVNRLALATFHFFIVIEVEVLEGTCGNIHTDGKINILGNVEAHTRSYKHRVVERVNIVITLFLQAHFTAEFNEEIHKLNRDEVQTSAIHERGGLAIPRRHNNTSRTVPTQGEIPLGEVHRESQTGTEGPTIGRQRLRIAFTIQVPGVSRTDSGLSFTRRGVSI